MELNRRFTSIDDCLVANCMKAQCQKEKPDDKKKEVTMCRNVLCSISKETSKQEVERFEKKLTSRKFKPHFSKGDYLDASKLVAHTCKIGKVTHVTKASHKHGGRRFEIYGCPETCTCFVEKPIGITEAISLEHSARLEEVISLIE